MENKLWVHEMRPDPEQTISACLPSSITHAINLKKANNFFFFSNGWVGLEGDGNKNTTALKLIRPQPRLRNVMGSPIKLSVVPNRYPTPCNVMIGR